MPAHEHVWFYERLNVLGEEVDVGPIQQQELVKLAHAGKLKRTTKVRSPSRTSDRWYEINQVPGLLKALEAGENERAEAKAQAEQARKDQQVAQQQAIAIRKSTEAEQAATISEGQDVSMVLSIAERVTAILSNSEVLKFIVVQERPLVNFSPDAVVITTRRLIFYRPKMLGRFSFEDYLLFDLHDAHLEQGFIASTFTARHTSGRLLKMEWLPKAAAQRLYRLAQELEHHARQARIQLDMEMRRAGASQINIANNVPPAAPAQATIVEAVVNPSTTANDPMQRLKKLKDMLEAGLISQADFDERKQQILSEI